MPIYEYQCSHCGHLAEITQKFSDPPLSACPECGSDEVKKLISRTSFQLKGGGWFADGYAAPAPKAKAEPKKTETAAKPSTSKPDSGGKS